MLPVVIEDKPCSHVKIYDEELLLQDTAIFKWKCGKCAAMGAGDQDIEFIYTYNQITVMRRKWDPDYDDE